MSKSKSHSSTTSAASTRNRVVFTPDQIERGTANDGEILYGKAQLLDGTEGFIAYRPVSGRMLKKIREMQAEGKLDQAASEEFTREVIADHVLMPDGTRAYEDEEDVCNRVPVVMWDSIFDMLLGGVITRARESRSGLNSVTVNPSVPLAPESTDSTQ